LGVLIADAQGHGFSAALLVAVLKTCLHGISEREPAAVLEAMNRAILENLNEIVMATCCYVLIDPIRHELRIASAGHITQYHLRADSEELDELKSQNLLLGFPGSREYVAQAGSRTWSAGDLLVLMTDGIIEATNAEDEDFGTERVRRAILRHRAKEPREIQQALYLELRNFVGDCKLKDDVTLVVARLHRPRTR
jgi:sigma-B regulation protein RsbU (phosphoserine phosphatase)